MSRRRSKGLPLIATLPWPVGIGLGIAGFLLVRYGVGGYLASSAATLTGALDSALLGGALTAMAWAVLVICWLGALASVIARTKRKQLLDAQTGLDSLGAMSWQAFEVLVGETFRRQGYVVEETGLGGADGGVDLILFKDGQRALVQCKQWRSRQVGVAVVREMWGLASHHHVDRIKIVSLGEFTEDAGDFVRGKPIELINGAALLQLVLSAQSSTPAKREPSNLQEQSRSCPSCSAPMLQRRNRTSQQAFWGCSTYPKCRGTRAR